ncbi:MAG: glycosyltransferase [Burkholderiaceae bacterium]
MRILYYCQSLVGVGHLACSLRIIEELVPFADVDLVYGGLDTATMFEHARLRALRLPTLLHDEDSGGLRDPDEADTVDSIWALRSAQIGAFVQGRYDAIVVEFYPFGRRRFKPEIMTMFSAVRDVSGPIPIFTSVREVLVPRPLETERRMVQTLRRHIHTVFVRSDPDVIRLDHTFSLAHEIEDKLVYTGYISAPTPATWPARKKQILVSQGGGNVGAELLIGAIGVAPLMPDFHFVLATGSRTSAGDVAKLQALLRSPNVQIVPFLADFQRHLRESAASISMGGDNTLLDVITARTPALAYPYQGNPEQSLRIEKFAQKGLLTTLAPADLAAEDLKAKILHAIGAPPSAHPIATDGARITSQKIRQIILSGAASRLAAAA